MLPNTIIILIAYTLTVWYFGWSIRKGKWHPVQPTPRTLTMMTIKLFVLYSLLWLFCWQFSFNAMPVLLVAGFVILLLCCTDSELAAPVLVVGYILLQWILGFPDKDRWIPPNKRYRQKTNIPETLIGKTATTQTPLRPTGYIQVDDKEYLAKSEINFIDKNTTVEITAITNGTILVNTS